MTHVDHRQKTAGDYTKGAMLKRKVGQTGSKVTILLKPTIGGNHVG